MTTTTQTTPTVVGRARLGHSSCAVDRSTFAYAEPPCERQGAFECGGRRLLEAVQHGLADGTADAGLAQLAKLTLRRATQAVGAADA